MAIKIKKGVAAAGAVIALILIPVLAGLAACQMPDSLDLGTPTGRVDTGPTTIGPYAPGRSVLSYFIIETGGYTGPARVNYYNPAVPPPATITTTLEVTVNAAGELEYDSSLTEPSDGIKSIEVAGKTYLIGRTDPDKTSPVTLKLLADGTLAFRGSAPSLIGSYAEFQLISTAPGGAYVLEFSLDLMGEEWTPVGSSASPFIGTFNSDPSNNTLSNLKIDTTTNDVGLFGVVGTSGTVEGIGILSGFVEGGNNVGAVAGTNDGTIEACYNADVHVEGTDNVGGVAGTSSGAITACYNKGEVKGTGNTGGVAGATTGGVITACYNWGEVTGGIAGGLVGDFSVGNLDACYNAGDVFGSLAGGLAGADGGNITECYWNDIQGLGETGVGTSGTASSSFTIGSFPPGSSWGASVYWKATSLSGGVLPELDYEP